MTTPIITPSSVSSIRYVQHDNAIAALVALRNCYAPWSDVYKALDANCETINRLGGRRGNRELSPGEVHQQAREGYLAAANYLKG